LDPKNLIFIFHANDEKKLAFLKIKYFLRKLFLWMQKIHFILGNNLFKIEHFHRGFIGK